MRRRLGRCIRRELVEDICLSQPQFCLDQYSRTIEIVEVRIGVFCPCLWRGSSGYRRRGLRFISFWRCVRHVNWFRSLATGLMTDAKSRRWVSGDVTDGGVESCPCTLVRLVPAMSCRGLFGLFVLRFSTAALPITCVLVASFTEQSIITFLRGLTVNADTLWLLHVANSKTWVRV